MAKKKHLEVISAISNQRNKKYKRITNVFHLFDNYIAEIKIINILHRGISASKTGNKSKKYYKIVVKTNNKLDV